MLYIQNLVNPTAWTFQSLSFEPVGSFIIQDANNPGYAISATACTTNSGQGNGNRGSISREAFVGKLLSDQKFHWYYEGRKLISVLCSNNSDREVIDISSCDAEPGINISSDSASYMYLTTGIHIAAIDEVRVRIESTECPGKVLQYRYETTSFNLASKLKNRPQIFTRLF